MTPRYMFTWGRRSVVGPVQGNGGKMVPLADLLKSQRLAREGHPHHLFEPRPGHVAVYPSYSAEGDGECVLVPLAEASIAPANHPSSGR